MLSVDMVYEEAFTKYCDIDFGLVNYTTNHNFEDEEVAGAL